MPRPKKFRLGELVIWGDRIGVVVDYRQDGRGRGEYRVVRLMSHSGSKPFGPAVWVKSHQLTKDTEAHWPYRRSAVTTYRANLKLLDRGCTCNCCPHLTIPPSQIRVDGSLIGEE